ncbi:hypothetical protein [Mesorhizobium huakuii]|uniref:Uncharacterized protein n=1 Tax=Mesorhizobium huakuii TaxID=28104 RepID=A0A7G6SSC4_9HYPH|nr:hypothetical protein [Mesorhizobium huakuii]QND57406.1 hypothetical protein HB778_12850 [Mesorhizobium huakuii]
MPRSSSGVFVQPAGTAGVPNTLIQSTPYNALAADIGNEITGSLPISGVKAMGANLPMGGFRVVNAADPSGAQDAATKNYVDTTFVAKATAREVLTAARTYYVRTDGNDSNTGLVNSAGGAFLTIQKAANVIAALDCSTFQAFVQVVDGTYTAGTSLPPYLGSLPPVIKGNNATPGNVIISTTGANCFTNASGQTWSVRDMELRSTTTGIHLSSTSGLIQYQNIRFGTCAEGHIFAFGGKCQATGAYSIVGNAQYHMAAVNGSVVANGITVTLSGTPAFSDVFVRAGRAGDIDCFSSAFSGSATGQRYDALTGGAIFTNGAAITYFPGSVAGVARLGGNYF